MTTQEVTTIVNELKAGFGSAFDRKQKKQIEDLYVVVLGKIFTPTNCQNCYHDAFLEIYKQLKNFGTMAQDCNYRLRAGFIINCPAFSDKIYTNSNLTDEVAARYLEMFPENKIYFQKLPQEAVKKAVEAVASEEVNNDTKKKRKAVKRQK